MRSVGPKSHLTLWPALRSWAPPPILPLAAVWPAAAALPAVTRALDVANREDFNCFAGGVPLRKAVLKALSDDDAATEGLAASSKWRWYGEARCCRSGRRSARATCGAHDGRPCARGPPCPRGSRRRPGSARTTPCGNSSSGPMARGPAAATSCGSADPHRRTGSRADSGIGPS